MNEKKKQKKTTKSFFFKQIKSRLQNLNIKWYETAPRSPSWLNDKDTFN